MHTRTVQSRRLVSQDMGAPLVEKLFEGFNGTLFAYGQTGSGKTYSMMGSPADPGVIPKVVAAIFERCAALAEGVGVRVRVRAITLTLTLTLSRCAALGEGVGVSVRASYLQIYREVLQDLSSKAPAEDLKILSLPNPIPP